MPKPQTDLLNGLTDDEAASILALERRSRCPPVRCSSGWERRPSPCTWSGAAGST